MKAVFAVVPLTIMLTGCELLGIAQNCTSDLRPAIRVSVVDSITAQPAVSGPGMAVATEGLFADTARFVSGIAALAYEREGSYTVQVLMEGYAPWIEDRIRVQADECHVMTVEITARVQPVM